MANAFDQAFITAWMVSSNASEVALRLGRVMTPGEVWATVRQLRRRGLDLTCRPGGLGGGNPLILTPHPRRQAPLARRPRPHRPPGRPGSPGGGRPAARGTGARCVLCDRLSSGGWGFVIGPNRRRFVCNRHVTAVG